MLHEECLHGSPTLRSLQHQGAALLIWEVSFPKCQEADFFSEGGDVPESLIIRSTIIKASTIKA